MAETAGGDEALTVETGGFFADSQSLVDALVSRGVRADVARGLERRIEPGNALLTLNPKDRDVAAALEIIEEHGGRIGGASSSDAWGAWPASERREVTDLDEHLDFEEVIFARR